jgi:hypothetical protein
LATDRDVDRLADRIADAGVFSDDRAEMISRTEINMAMNQGVLEAGRQAQAQGMNVRKVWTLGANPCPQCEDAAAEGDIDLEEDFGSDAGDSPPLHPNCECSLDLFVADEDQTDADEGDDDMQKRHDDDADDEHGDNGQRHIVDELADLLVEGGSPDGEVTREQALQWLLHSTRGQALVARMAQHRKRATNKGKAFTMPTREEVLKGYLKAAGSLDRLAAQIVKRGTTDIAEAEMVGMITATAQRESGLSEERAFSRLYTDPSPRGLMLRKAVNICKAAPLEIMPVQVGGDDVDVNDAEKAYTQLKALADEQRRRSPELTSDQAFARVFSDPNNAALAARAHKRPAPTTSYPFPR